MKKLSLVAAVALLGTGIAFAAGPAAAASFATCNADQEMNSGLSSTNSIDSNTSGVIAGLAEHGVTASSVEDVGGCIKATVKTTSGAAKVEFFDPLTYQRVS